MNVDNNLENALKCSAEVNTDYEGEIFGTSNTNAQIHDTFVDALHRYMAEYQVTRAKLSENSGLSKSTVHNYYYGKVRRINANIVYAICIALRLHPSQQRQLLKTAKIPFPDEWGDERDRAFIIRDFLDSCYYDEKYTVAACNKRLVEKGLNPLTPLISIVEGKENG